MGIIGIYTVGYSDSNIKVPVVIKNVESGKKITFNVTVTKASGTSGN